MHRPLLLAALLCAAQAHAQANESAPIPRSAGLPYAAGKLADRIVLTPGQNAATQMAISYRTDLAQADAVR